MCDKNRPCSNDAVDKMIGNMTAEMQNVDGQYVPLGFTSAPPAAETLNWSGCQDSYINHYNLHYSEPHLSQPVIEPYQQSQNNYIPETSSLFQPVIYKKNLTLSEYNNMYPPGPNGAQGSLYNGYMPQNILPDILPESLPQTSGHAQLIENLVGNWVVPNNSGTYSPFGNTEVYKPNTYNLPNHSDLGSNGQAIKTNCINLEKSPDDKLFQFNRDVRKPRIVAEVKPMRPSYSDVLTKPVSITQAKMVKPDNKENKLKKDNRKNAKTEKIQKVSGTLNRSNTNNDIKEVPSEKYLFNKTDKKVTKPNNLNRRWASLDNISEPHINKLDDSKRKKQEEYLPNKSNIKQSKSKINKTLNDIGDLEPENIKIETFTITKNNLKKAVKSNIRQKQHETSGSHDRPLGKRNQRTRKKENHVIFGFVGQKIKQYIKGWWKIFIVFMLWLFQLISDICTLSLHISRDVALNGWTWSKRHVSLLVNLCVYILQRVRLFTWIWEKFKGRKKFQQEDDRHNFPYGGLQTNITMPTTGDEAMKRLLACKGKDPYSILGVTPTCTDDDIKKYYKRQAVLVHPDKNNQPGAEEAFKILVHAFDMIGTPARRSSYDRGVAESANAVQQWTELTVLLQDFQEKFETLATTIRCSACGLRHKRTKMERPSYAARNCKMCKIHHSAREGDIWAEARCLGFRWHYFACMEGAVYDITAWAACQKESLKHLKPDSHHVQYRIALGKQNPPRKNSNTRGDRPDLENLLNSLYGQNEGGSRRRTKNKK